MVFLYYFVQLCLTPSILSPHIFIKYLHDSHLTITSLSFWVRCSTWNMQNRVADRTHVVHTNHVLFCAPEYFSVANLWISNFYNWKVLWMNGERLWMGICWAFFGHVLPCLQLIFILQWRVSDIFLKFLDF